MFITKETDYAIRLLRGLKIDEKKTVLTLSTEEQVPQQFAYKILKKLQKAGFINIIRGAEGGVILAIDLKHITMLDLMNCTGEESSISSCVRPNFTCAWCVNHNKSDCNVHNHLSNIQDKLNEELKKHSLYEIIYG